MNKNFKKANDKVEGGNNMDFFDKLGKKVSETYNVASEKTSKLAKEAKLKVSISEAQEKIEREYIKIGKNIYEKYLNHRDDDVALTFIEEFKTIDKLKESVRNSEKEILDLKDKKKCNKCGSEFEAKFEFCPNCGAKNEQEEPQVFEAEIVNKEDSNPQD